VLAITCLYYRFNRGFFWGLYPQWLITKSQIHMKVFGNFFSDSDRVVLVQCDGHCNTWKGEEGIHRNRKLAAAEEAVQVRDTLHECAKSHSRIDYDFDERQYYFSFPFLLYFNSNRKHLSNLSLNFSLISLLGWVLYYSHTTLFCIFANINDVHYLYPNTSNGWTISSKTSLALQ